MTTAECRVVWAWVTNLPFGTTYKKASRLWRDAFLLNIVQIISRNAGKVYGPSDI